MGASINIVNLAEICYILHRRSREAAEEKEENLRNYGVKVVPVDPESPLWKKAASLKAQHTMSLADAFAFATALELKSRLVTGADKDFDGIQGLKIERV
jgi:predicted nucleic acid-binding protein